MTSGGARDGIRALATLLALAGLATACGWDPPPTHPLPPTDSLPPTEERRALLVVGDPAALNESERAVRDRLEVGFAVTLVDDGGLGIPSDCALVVMSKTVLSSIVGDRLRRLACGVVFWEDNQQQIGLMATISADGASGTAWHSMERTIIVDDDAPAELRAGLVGSVTFYREPAEVTWAPEGTLPPTARVVARIDQRLDSPTAIYAYDVGDPLADGTPAPGRRVYFGLYDDTFRLLTPGGLALFDAAVAWAGR